MSTNNLTPRALLNRKYNKPLFNRKRFIATFKPKKNILDLSLGLLSKIFDFIDDSDDYQSLRLTCSRFYSILENYKEFDSFGYVSKIYYINNHVPFKLEHYNVIKLDNQYPINYLISECYLKNKKKYGVEIGYNYNKDIILRKMWRKGKLNGVCQYFENNKMIQQITFYDGLENGEKITIVFDLNVLIKTLYGIGLKLNVKKYQDNVLVVNAKFRNKSLHGETVVYFNEPYRVGDIKNILNFNRGLLHNTCLIHEHDRILKLQFKNGLLHGRQAIFTIENKLKCLIDFEQGKIWGRYALFNTYKKIEEGYNYDGVLKGNITIFNPIELTHYIYPFENSMLNGEYIEKINSTETRLYYSENKFIGRFIFNDVTMCESVEINFYNLNNFEYRKYLHGKEMILLTKKYGKYTLTIYNMNKDSPNLFLSFRQRRKKYELTNFFKCYSI